MRRAGWILAVGLMAGAPQEAEKPCDLAQVVDASYCWRCRRVLLPSGRPGEPAPVDKEGRCAVCGTPAEKAKACLKSWVPHCGMHDMKPHEKPCCSSPTCCRVEAHPAPVNYGCEGCGSTASLEEKILHRRFDHEKKIRRICSASGRFPHGGAFPGKEPAKKEKEEEKEKPED